MSSNKVAVIGMAGVFPGAENIADLWSMLISGKSGIRSFQEDELAPEARALKRGGGERYVASKGYLNNAYEFDHTFFGMSKKDAQLLDPQQRHFLQVCWNAFHDAGYSPSSVENRRIGVYASSSVSDYAQTAAHQMDMSDWQQSLSVHSNNLRDLIATRISALLNLHGPSLNVQTACSSSMAALHEAWRGLLFGDCDLALAGGAAVRLPQESGHHYHENGVYSKDGNCQPFDANSSGTVSGNGVAAVVLKRLDDALRDGNHVYAIIDAVLANNDGSRKVGFTAPSLEGQCELFTEALEYSGIDCDALCYVEAHGTATPLGDPIEFTALNKALSKYSTQKHYCHLGSIKANVGHLDAAAGMTGFIKACLILQHRQVPPHPSFTAPNPHLDYAGSPFVIRNRLTELSKTGTLHAAVNAVGIGGTNVVAILSGVKEPVPQKKTGRHYFPFSVQENADLSRNHKCLREFLNRSEGSQSDLSARMASQLRGLKTKTGAWADWSNSLPADIISEQGINADARSICLIFPGGGSFFPQSLRIIKQEFPIIIEEWKNLIRNNVEEPYAHEVIDYLMEGTTPQGDTERDIYINLLITFLLNHCAMMVLNHLGVKADVVMGHSLGEYNAAVYAGTMAPVQALEIIKERAAIVAKAPARMVYSVFTNHVVISTLLEEYSIEIIAFNDSESLTVTLPQLYESEFKQRLRSKSIAYKKARIVASAHSSSLSEFMDDFRVYLSDYCFRPLQMPLVSNSTGKVMPAGTIPDSSYWVAHLREPVRFSSGIETLKTMGPLTYIQAGAGDGLAKIAAGPHENAVSLIGSRSNEKRALLSTVGALYHLQKNPQFPGLPDQKETVPHVPLPPYQFRLSTCKIDAKKAPATFTETGNPHEYLEVLAPLDWPQLGASSPFTGIALNEWLQNSVVDEEHNFIEVSAPSDLLTTDMLLKVRDRLHLANEDKVNRKYVFILSVGGEKKLSHIAPFRNFCVCINQELTGISTAVLVRHPGSMVNARGLAAILEHGPGAYLASGGQIYQPAFLKRAHHRLQDENTAQKLDGTLLLIGGTGRIGFHLAADLLTQTNCDLILVGRQKMSQQDAKTALIQKASERSVDEERLKVLRERSDRWQYVSADLSEADSFVKLLSQLEAANLHNITATLCLTAESYDDSIRKTLDSVTSEDLALQCRSKQGVLESLTQLEKQAHVHRTILFGSNAGKLGGVGMFSYSIASGFWDAWADEPAQQASRLSISFDAFRFVEHGRSVEQYIDGEHLTSLVIRLIQSPVNGSVLLSNTDYLQRYRKWVSNIAENPAIAVLKGDIPPLDHSGIDDLEREIFAHWEDLLGEEEIAKDADFFDLGGHSLAAFRMFAALRKRYSVQITLLDLVKHPTFSDFVDFIKEKLDGPLLETTIIGKAEHISLESLLEKN